MSEIPLKVSNAKSLINWLMWFVPTSNSHFSFFSARNRKQPHWENSGLFLIKIDNRSLLKQHWKCLSAKFFTFHQQDDTFTQPYVRFYRCDWAAVRPVVKIRKNCLWKISNDELTDNSRAKWKKITFPFSENERKSKNVVVTTIRYPMRLEQTTKMLKKSTRNHGFFSNDRHEWTSQMIHTPHTFRQNRTRITLNEYALWLAISRSDDSTAPKARN